MYRQNGAVPFLQRKQYTCEAGKAVRDIGIAFNIFHTACFATSKVLAQRACRLANISGTDQDFLQKIYNILCEDRNMLLLLEYLFSLGKKYAEPNMLDPMNKLMEQYGEPALRQKYGNDFTRQNWADLCSAFKSTHSSFLDGYLLIRQLLNSDKTDTKSKQRWKDKGQQIH